MLRTLSASLTIFACVLSAGLASAQDRNKRWYAMDYGPCLSATIQDSDGQGFSLKGRAIDLGAGAWVTFDTELLRMADAVTSGYLKLRGTTYDGAHGPVSSLVGDAAGSVGVMPGWAKAGSFDDPRPIPHGPLPRDWGRFKGSYLNGEEVVLAYEIGKTRVLEKFDVVEHEGQKAISRTLELAAHTGALEIVLSTFSKRDNGGVEGDSLFVFEPELILPKKKAGRKAGKNKGKKGAKKNAKAKSGNVKPSVKAENVTPVPISQAVVIVSGSDQITMQAGLERLTATIAPSSETQRIKILYWRGKTSDRGQLSGMASAAGPASKLEALCHGGPARWPETLQTEGKVAESTAAYVVDTITVPKSNPWNSWLRFGAFDFVDANTAALSTWSGDVWLVSGLDGDLKTLTWKRYATGLHDPLGLKVVDGVIYTHGRDQITRLKDLNGDGEADLYETFNNDVMITKGFHEFAFDLQTDAEGNFYFSKGAPVRPGGRGFTKIVPHNGTVLKLSKDGQKLDIFATGLRAPNGIGVLPNGVVTSGENEGTWVPACRINYMRQGAFMGVKDTSHRLALPGTYEDPLCWLPMSVDNSGGGQVYVSSDAWGPLKGQFLHQSYGHCSVYLVLPQEQDGRIQGGVVRIPVDFASSQMRGRFHPKDGQLYVCGFKGWQTRAVKDTAFQRVRYTGKPIHLPTGMTVTADGIYLGFSETLDPETATDLESYVVEQWNYKYSVAYGSAEYSPSKPEKKVKKGVKNRDAVAVKSATLLEDGRTVFLAIDGLKRVMQMRINYNLDSAAGELIEGDIYNTINYLGHFEKPAGN